MTSKFIDKKSLLANVVKISLELNNTEQSLRLIHSFFENLKSDRDFTALIRKTKFFDNSKLGKSGAKVGIIKLGNKELVFKYFRLEEKRKYKIDYSEGCIKIYFPFNELIVNSIFENIELFLTPKKYTIYQEKFQKYLIPIKRIGLNKKHSFMISDKIGFNFENNYYTNLYEIIINNHIPKIIENIDNQKILDIFFSDFANKLKDYFKCIKFLNENLGYINSDFKCKNIFIKKKTYEKKNNNLGFITDFIPLISDLDKASLEFKKLKILPRTDKVSERILTKYKNTIYSKVYEFRYSCSRKNNLCDRFKPYQYDIITFLYDLYTIFFLRIYDVLDIEINDYLGKLKILNKFVIKTLNLTEEEFIIFHNRINKKIIFNNFEENGFGLHINTMLYYFCKYLN